MACALKLGAVLAAAMLLSGGAPDPAAAAPAREIAVKSLAPSGRLRVAINLGNGVLAQRDGSGALTGVSVALARALAGELGLDYDLVPYTAAGEVFDDLERGGWDLAFLAVEPERAARIEFSPPYVFIDGTYLVRKGSPFRTAADLDRPGVRIAVGRGAAYDLYLSRTLSRAELKRAPTSAAAIGLFQSDGLEAAAGVRQALVDAARGRDDLVVLQDRFTRIDQAVAVPKGRPEAAAYVRGFLQRMKASGMIRAALDATGQDGAVVAP